MSNCVLIAADHPLPGVRPSQDAPFCLLSFDEVDLYCGKKYGMCLELPQWTEEGGRRILAYIRAVLQQNDSVELWNVWLLGYWEFEDRPHIRKRTVRIDELTAEEIKGLIEAENWDNRDPNRPSFYGLEMIR